MVRGIIGRRANIITASTNRINDVKFIEPGNTAPIHVARVSAVSTELPMITRTAPAVTAEAPPTLAAAAAKPVEAADALIATVVTLTAVEFIRG
jgi:hypothetical protein